jgi:anti-anti-sigma factor
MDASSAHLLTEYLDAARLAPLSEVRLDMADIAFISVAGVRALLHARAAITGIGGRLTLRRPSHCTSRMLELAGVAGQFPEAPDPPMSSRDGRMHLIRAVADEVPTAR